MLDWILEKLPVVIFVVVFLAQLVRGFVRMRGARTEPPPRHDELEQDRRNREIQEEIRRKIAERRAGRSPAPEVREAEPQEGPAPPVLPPRDPTALPVPEPLRRMLEQLEKKAQPAPPVPPPAMAMQRRGAELERQERLAEEIRSLEETRVLTQRRAKAVAAAKADHLRSETGLRTAARGKLLDDLRDPESLRRAFVLREVLGPPVGLR